MLRQPNVLLLSTDQTETAQLQQLLGEHAILTPVARRSELISLLERRDYDAIFCAWAFQQGTWNEVLHDVRESCPDLPVVIFSRTGGEQEWVKVLEAGAFDLLVAPYQQHTVIPILEQAVSSYGRGGSTAPVRTLTETPSVFQLAKIQRSGENT